MIKGLASIIIPIYGVEKYLDRCIKSVVNQSYEKLEIILVDDGSPDNCPKMCDSWVERDSRIKVIHKKNAGLGMARNSGIEVAEGEYLFFIDSDDYIATSTVEEVMSEANRSNADFITFGHYEENSTGKITREIVPNTQKKVYHGEEIQNTFLADMMAPDPDTGIPTNLWMSAWTNAYSYSLVHKNKWQFVSEREYISEDIYSLLCLFKDIESVSVIPKAFYYYCSNDTSLTHTYKKDRYIRLQKFYDSCQKKCDELSYNQNVKKRLSHLHMYNVIGTMYLIIQSDMQEKKKRKLLSEIVNDDQMQKIIHSMDIHKEKIARRLLYYAIRSRLTWLVHYMVKAKSRQKTR